MHTSSTLQGPDEPLVVGIYTKDQAGPIFNRNKVWIYDSAKPKMREFGKFQIFDKYYS